MAWTAPTQWELRTTGTNNGGAGFDPAFGGTDYSQQNSPQATAADGASTGNTTFTSAAALFTSQIKGNGLRVFIGATDQGWFQITGFTNSTTITVDRNLPNASGMTWYVGGAYTPSASGFAVPYVAGNKIWMGPGTYAFTTTALALSVSGTVTLPIVVEGYTAIRGDGGATPVIQSSAGGTLFALNGDFNFAKNLTFSGPATSGDLVQLAGSHCGLHNCIIRANSSSGTVLRFANSFGRVNNCEIVGGANSGDLIVFNNVTVGNILEYCEVVGGGAVSGSGVTHFGQRNTVQYNIIRNLPSDGIYSSTNSSDGLVVRNNDIWNNGQDGLMVFSTTGGLKGVIIEGNIIGRNARYDLAYNASDVSGQFGTQEWAKLNIRNNAFFSTGTQRYFQLPAGSGDVGLGASPFVDDTTTFNFQLNQTAGAGAVLMSGYNFPWIDGVNVGTYGYGALGFATAATPARQFNQGAPVIDEVQFPPQISRGMQGGPGYNTVVVAASGGAEQRVGQWTRPRYRWEINNSPKQPSEMQAIINFFHAREGRLRGWRFKDWSDFTATNEPLAPTGASTVQLIKTYSSGPSSIVRNIYKPVASPAVTLQRNGSAYLTFSLDTTTGLVTLTADSTATITGITQASQAVITTSAPHGFTAGQTIFISGVVGMTQINGLTGVIQSTTSTTFTLNINSTAFTAYTSGGVASKFIQPGESLTWAGQFDVPVRFDVDELKVVFEDATSYSLDNVPIIEVRTNS